MKKILLAVLLIFIFTISTSLAYGETSMYLKLDGIDGDSDYSSGGWIDITAWGWDITNLETQSTNRGRSSARPDVGPIYVQKYVDRASPLLFINALDGSHISSGELVLFSEDYQDIIVKIEMSIVTVINIQSSVESSDGMPMESVALNFSKVCYIYTPYDDEGGALADIRKCWDLAANIEQ